MIDHFSILAPVYERLIPRPDPRLLSELLSLAPDSCLLDAAGGTGRVAALFARDVKRTVVCDESAAMLRQARHKGLETAQAPLEALPFNEATFDRILLVDAFHHLADQDRAIAELLRVLKPSGRLVIEEPDIRLGLVKLVALLEKLSLMRSHFVSAEQMMGQIVGKGGQARIAHRGRFRVWLVVTRQSETLDRASQR